MNPFIVAAAISAGSQLFGGIADRRQAQRNYERNDLIKTMKDAQEAGFHPLEALRAGYTQSQIAQAPRISSMGVAANAVDAAASMYRDAMAQEKQSALIDAQIENIEADTQRMGSISTYAGSMPRVGNMNSQLADSSDGYNFTGTGEAAMPAPVQYGGDADESVPERLAATKIGPTGVNENLTPQLTLGGVNWSGSGLFSSGQTVEDSLGEGPLQWVVSPLIATDMIIHTSMQKAWERHRNGQRVGFNSPARGEMISNSEWKLPRLHNPFSSIGALQ